LPKIVNKGKSISANAQLLTDVVSAVSGCEVTKDEIDKIGLFNPSIVALLCGFES
jgi:hypothetical protein